MSGISLPGRFLSAYNYLIWDSTEGDIPFEFGCRAVELLTRYLPCACGRAQIGFRLFHSDTIGKRSLFARVLCTSVRPNECKFNPRVISLIGSGLPRLAERELQRKPRYLAQGRFSFHLSVTEFRYCWYEKQSIGLSLGAFTVFGSFTIKTWDVLLVQTVETIGI